MRWRSIIALREAGLQHGGLPATARFRRWFAGSKVVDAEGRPLVCHHGTTAGPGFTPGGNLHYGTMAAAAARGGDLADLTAAGLEANPLHRPGTYIIHRCYLAIRRPMEFADLGENWFSDDAFRMMGERGYLPDAAARLAAYEASGHEADDWIAVAQRHGFDGVLYRNGHEDAGSISWYPFDARQVWLIPPDDIVSTRAADS